MIPGIIPAVVGGIGSALSTMINAKKAKQNTDLQNRENMRLADIQYERDKQQLQEMNRYNEPAQQMKRFREAGLNPALMYSQGSPGSQTQLIKYNNPGVAYNYRPYFDPEAVLSKYQNTQVTNRNLQGKYLQNLLTNKNVNIAEFKQRDLANRFFEMWNGYGGYGDTLGEKLMALLLPKAQTELYKSQADYAIKQQLNALNAYEVAFRGAGGRFFNPAIQVVRMLLGK